MKSGRMKIIKDFVCAALRRLCFFAFAFTFAFTFALTFAFTSALFPGCATQYPVYKHVIPVPVPEVSDSLRVSQKTDTVVIANHTHGIDTLVLIKYFPTKEKFFYRIKRDTLFIPFSDTVYRKEFIEKDSGSNFYLITGCLIASLLLTVFIYKKVI